MFQTGLMNLKYFPDIWDLAYAIKQAKGHDPGSGVPVHCFSQNRTNKLRLLHTKYYIIASKPNSIQRFQAIRGPFTNHWTKLKYTNPFINYIRLYVSGNRELFHIFIGVSAFYSNQIMNDNSAPNYSIQHLGCIYYQAIWLAHVSMAHIWYRNSTTI